MKTGVLLFPLVLCGGSVCRVIEIFIVQLRFVLSCEREVSVTGGQHVDVMLNRSPSRPVFSRSYSITPTLRTAIRCFRHRHPRRIPRHLLMYIDYTARSLSFYLLSSYRPLCVPHFTRCVQHREQRRIYSDNNLLKVICNNLPIS